MNKQIKNKFPLWCNDNNTNYSLCLSDDIDSLLSCIALILLKGYEITHFYIFNAIGESKEVRKGNLIGVDIDLTQGKTWGNHVTMLSKADTYNKECANINVVKKISRENYYSKFCSSTLLQILSYYNVKLDKLTEEAKMILMCVDSSFLPFYSTRFKDTGTYYLNNVLEFPELVELTKRHTKNDFEELNNKYNLKEKIHVKNGYLETKINLAELSRIFSMPITLPKEGFDLLAEFKTDAKSIEKGNYNIVKEKDMFSLAVTNRDFYVYSK